MYISGFVAAVFPSRQQDNFSVSSSEVLQAMCFEGEASVWLSGTCGHASRKKSEAWITSQNTSEAMREADKNKLPKVSSSEDFGLTRAVT